MSGPALSDPQVRDLARRIRLKEDGDLTSLFPEQCLARSEVLCQIRCLLSSLCRHVVVTFLTSLLSHSSRFRALM